MFKPASEKHLHTHYSRIVHMQYIWNDLHEELILTRSPSLTLNFIGCQFKNLRLYRWTLTLFSNLCILDFYNVATDYFSQLIDSFYHL